MDKINFVNLPSTTTPLNATNLNQLQTNVDNAKIEKAKQLDNTDLNTLTDTCVYYCTNSVTNKPTTGNGWVVTFGGYNNNYIRQCFYEINNNNEYTRRKYGGTWTDWAYAPVEISGTWTPRINTRANVAPTVTYGDTTTGSYRRIGRMVFITFYISGKITALNDTNNYGVVSGLPFIPKNYTSGECAITLGSIYNLGTTTNTVTMYARNGYNGQIWLQQNNGAGALVLKLSGDTNFHVAGSGWYEIS